MHVDAYTSCTLLGTKLGRGLSIFIAGPILIPMRVCMFYHKIAPDGISESRFPVDSLIFSQLQFYNHP